MKTFIKIRLLYEKNTIFIIGELSDGDHIEMVEYRDIISPRRCFGYQAIHDVSNSLAIAGEKLISSTGESEFFAYSVLFP